VATEKATLSQKSADEQRLPPLIELFHYLPELLFKDWQLKQSQQKAFRSSPSSG
jgi:hypothetical protein